MIDLDEVVSRVSQVRDEIARAGGQRVALVAVTKSFGVEAMAAALTAHCDAVGENYAQELLDKVSQGLPAIDVHFIGHLQSNKVKALAPHVSLWQSVDSKSVIDEVAKRSPGANILLQVNTTGETTKGGIAPTDVDEYVDTARAVGLMVTGLMTIGPTDGTDDAKRTAFSSLRRLVDTHNLEICSMGMSDDYLMAVECGSTMVRIGSRLFGPRPARN